MSEDYLGVASLIQIATIPNAPSDNNNYPSVTSSNLVPIYGGGGEVAKR